MKNELENTGHITFEDFCNVCGKKRKFQIDVNDYKKEVVGYPYCLSCKTIMPDMLEKHIKEINDTLDIFHPASDIIVNTKEHMDEKNNKVIYFDEDFPYFSFLIRTLIIPALFILGIFLLTKTEMENIIPIALIFGPINLLVVISAIVEYISVRKFNSWITYMKNYGEKFDGKVIRIIQREIDSVEFDKSYIEYYFEIEYHDENNIRKTFVTKRLQKPPLINNIRCSVYKIDRLPSKYKNKKKYSKELAYDFYW